MESELHALELPAFELDCRDWLIATPQDGSVPEEIGGTPVVAVLSTAVIGDLRTLIGARSPFTVRFDECRRFPNGLHLAPTPDRPFREMTESIAQRWRRRHLTPADSVPVR